MATENLDLEQEKSSRSLMLVAVINAILWIISIIVVIFTFQSSATSKGLFVILSVGLFVSLALITMLQNEELNPK